MRSAPRSTRGWCGSSSRPSNRAKAEGVGIIYVSHHLDQIFTICDSVTVLRDGQVVGGGPIGEFDEARLSSMMVGRIVMQRRYSSTAEAHVGAADSEPYLELHGTSTERFADVSLNVGRGEVLGIAGLEGSGSEAILESLFGLRQLQTGSMRLVAASTGRGRRSTRLRGGWPTSRRTATPRA